jgi:hypothetical protein
MEAYGVQEGDIYNMDESFRLGEGKDENTISRADLKQAKVSSSYTRILVMILECIGIDRQVPNCLLSCLESGIWSIGIYFISKSA